MIDGAHRPTLQPAFVLHQRPYRESSALLEVFTERWGRTGLVAKGARRPRSQLRAALQPFRPLLLSWSARGELGTLTGAEPAGPPHCLRGEALFQAMYVNELLIRLLHRQDPHPGLFAVYAGALDALAAVGAGDSESVLRRFEVALLDALGYALVLDHAADTGAALDADARYRYVAERGPVTPGTDEGAAAHAPDGSVFSGRTLLWLAGSATPGACTAAEAKRLMRSALRPILGEKPVATRSLFRRPPRG